MLLLSMHNKHNPCGPRKQCLCLMWTFRYTLLTVYNLSLYLIYIHLQIVPDAAATPRAIRRWYTVPRNKLLYFHPIWQRFRILFLLKRAINKYLIASFLWNNDKSHFYSTFSKQHCYPFVYCILHIHVLLYFMRKCILSCFGYLLLD